MKTVGIRQLRDNLSRYMEEVKKGEIICATEHNVPIAQIIPVSDIVDALLAKMIANGQVSWNGGKPKGNPYAVYSKGRRSLAEMVSEDRR